jgi:hypothetical protein
MTSSPARLPLSIFALLTLAGTGVAAPSVAWRVPVSGPGLTQRPAIGPSGEIAVHGTELVVIEPDGTVRFRQSIGVASSTGNVCDIDDAGRIYATTFTGLHAFSPSGDLLWTAGSGSPFTTHAGPNVGPDGNVYLIEEGPGDLGMASFDPSGLLRWNVPGYNNEIFQNRMEIAFDHDSVFAASDFIPVDCDCLNSGVISYTFDGQEEWVALTAVPHQPVVSAQGSIHLRIATFDFATIDVDSGGVSYASFSPQGVTSSAPAVGPDGTAYAWLSGNDLLKVGSSGSTQELISGSGFVAMGNPAISPDGSVLVCGTADAIFGVPGEISGFDPATGQRVWSIDLGTEGGWNLIATGRPRFSEDGRTVYVGVNAGNSSYVYAVDLVDPVLAGDADGSGAVDLADLNIVLASFGQGGPAGDVDGSGSVDLADLNIVLGNFGAGV